MRNITTKYGDLHIPAPVTHVRMFLDTLPMYPGRSGAVCWSAGVDARKKPGRTKTGAGFERFKRWVSHPI